MHRPRRNDKLVAAVASKLRALRKQWGLFQVAVCSDTDIHIGCIETGRASVSVLTPADLCAYYGITLEEFIKGVFVK